MKHNALVPEEDKMETATQAVKAITITNALKKAGFQKWDGETYGFQVTNYNDDYFVVEYKMFCKESAAGLWRMGGKLPKFTVTQMVTMYRDTLRDAGYEVSFLENRGSFQSFNYFKVTGIK